MSRASLNLWVAGLLDAGAAPATARVRQLAVRRFAQEARRLNLGDLGGDLIRLSYDPAG
jgi:hypothetical protein